MSKKTLIAGVLGAAAAFAAYPAMAQQPAWYIGATIGQSDYDEIEGDTKDTAWRILGGYQFHRNFAAEIGYHNLGKASTVIPGLVNVEWETTLWELVGVGSLPIANQFSVYGKAGVYRAEQELSGTILGVTGRDKDTNTDFTFGFGVRFDVTRQLGIRGEWQRYTNVGGDNVGGKADIDVLSIGAVWRF